MKKISLGLVAIPTSVQGIIGCISLLIVTGCQIHKPVPVEYLHHSSGKPHHVSHHKAPRPAPSPASPAVQTRVPVSYSAPQASPNQQWKPINIQPLGRLNARQTQPLNQNNFKPNPQNSRFTRPPGMPQNDLALKSGAAPQARVHHVMRGESLYGIARKYGVNVKTLASFNNLYPPYEIYPQQTLALIAGAVVASPGVTPPFPRQALAQPAPPPAAQFNRSVPTQPALPFAQSGAQMQWAWPASGQLIGNFSAGQSKGIEIAGEPGRAIRASADGTVVYSGNQVTGYGELIIVEHPQGFMTTYAHNRRLLVNQGERVKRGQKIAEMGSSEANQTKLHFEIRQGEKPVDPLAYLPPR